MLKQTEGSRAAAKAVARCRPEVIAACPVPPQTQLVDELSRLVKSGSLKPCTYVDVESAFAALSTCVGASAAGARTCTATASPGLLHMVEPLYNASRLGLPIVLTVANHASGAPSNAGNDHSDTMSQRDSGWIQLYARDHQEAADLHPQAFWLAEELSLPVMVCVDGFAPTHVRERIKVPEQSLVDAFLPPYESRRVLDPDDSVSIGARVGPDASTEVRYLAHAKQMRALEAIPDIAAEFRRVFGRDSGGLIHPYCCDFADTVVVALGSVLGTVCDVVDEMREAGVRIGALGITSFRPFPLEAVRTVLGNAQRVVVLERALAVGVGGIVSANVRTALSGIRLDGHTVVAGLGGRPIAEESLHRLLTDAITGRLGKLTFLDLDTELVERELARMARTRRSGPSTENMLRAPGSNR
ncbi:pyruvate ferredoxin oxidoreductase [Streptomyces sp. WSLK1-3]|uniref:pyruvate ferredoxin oxidoreductase n=1 Tax=Streptomyces sp. WSLK1-3 TaxID=3375475 RepID=UPI0037A62A08